MSSTPRYARTVNEQAHYATDDELDWMYEFGKQLPHGAQMVMLGVGPGVFLLALKEANPNLSAYIVDTGQFAALIYLDDAGWPQNVVHEMDDSVRAGRAWSGGPIDFLIIDTDHTEETTRREIDVWLPHVREGGTIFFHDYDANGTWFEKQEQYPGVKRAVDQLMVYHERICRVGTAVVFRKRVEIE